MALSSSWHTLLGAAWYNNACASMPCFKVIKQITKLARLAPIIEDEFLDE